MKKLILIPIFLCAAATGSFAQSVIIPQTMSFQGYVTQSDTAYTGNALISLALFDSSVSGNQVWSNKLGQTVQVFHGYYTVPLDFSTGTGTGWAAGVVPWSKPYWLDATILDSELVPRVQLTASAYSFRAQVADSATNVPSSVPIGTVVAYAGTQQSMTQSDWMICDGSSISATLYPNYASAFESIYGDTVIGGAPFVFLPDYRGMFLRGVNDTRNDSLQDTTGRIPPPHGGLAGNQVGSIQQDAFQGHMHDFWAGAYPQGTNGTDPTQATLLYGAMDNYDSIHRVVTNPQTGRPQGMLNGGVNGWEHWTIASDTVDGNPRYSSETRPKNAYVYWIIKVK